MHILNILQFCQLYFNKARRKKKKRRKVEVWLIRKAVRNPWVKVADLEALITWEWACLSVPEEFSPWLRAAAGTAVSVWIQQLRPRSLCCYQYNIRNKTLTVTLIQIELNSETELKSCKHTMTASNSSSLKE